MADDVIIEIETGIPLPTFRSPRFEGSCNQCHRIPRPGYSTCNFHLGKVKQARIKRVAANLCTWGSCKEEPGEGHSVCAAHRRAMVQNNTSMRAKRKARGMCVYCNQRPGWFGLYCAICRITQHRAAPNSLPAGARRALKQYRRFESINDRRAKAEELLSFVDDERAHQIIALRQGLPDGIDHTLEEIGAELDITRERVRQIEDRALKLLEYQGHDVSLIRPPFKAVQRPRKKPPISEEQRKKNRAHHMVTQAVKAGDLVKQPCQECGDINAIAHHHDYDKPLDVEWLCRRHHMAAHGRGKGTQPHPKMNAKGKHKGTWLNKIVPVNEHYDATKIVRVLRAHKANQQHICAATGLKRTALIDIAHGRPVSDHELLIMLRFIERLQPSEKNLNRPIDRFLDN